MMKKILYILILILAVPLASAQETNAQDQQKQPAENKTASGQKTPESAKAAADNKTPEPAKTVADKKTRTPDTFIPSEAISEDLSVSFPVDM